MTVDLYRLNEEILNRLIWGFITVPITMADRKAELERKKQRLAQMREEKERRRKEKERLDAESAAQSLLDSRAGSSSPSRTCNLIKSITTHVHS